MEMFFPHYTFRQQWLLSQGRFQTKANNKSFRLLHTYE